MSEREINGIRRKFIIASTLSFFMVMLAMGGLIYLFTSISARNEVRQVMDVIIENDGELPKPAGPESSGDEVSAETAAAEEAEAREEEAEDDERHCEARPREGLAGADGLKDRLDAVEARDEGAGHGDEEDELNHSAEDGVLLRQTAGIGRFFSHITSPPH